MKVSAPYRVAALLALGICIAAQSKTIGELNASFAMTCGMTPTVPCARTYWYGAYQIASSDAQQFETNFNSPFFQAWCNLDFNACLSWAMQWMAATDGASYAQTLSNYWSEM